MATSMRNRQIMSENLIRYIERSGKTRKQVADDLGISYSTFTDWINGSAYPRIDRIEEMAKYFGCRVADLVEEPGFQTDNGYYFDNDAADLAEFLHKSPEYKVLFDASRKVKAEDIEKVAKMIDLMRGDG